MSSIKRPILALLFVAALPLYSRAQDLPKLNPLTWARPTEALTPERERDLRAFIVLLFACAQERICEPVDFLWHVDPANIFYPDPSGKHPVPLLRTEKAEEKWQDFLRMYQVLPEPKEKKWKKDIAIIVTDEERTDFSAVPWRINGDYLISFTMTRGFYAHEAVHDSHMSNIQGKDLLEGLEELIYGSEVTGPPKETSGSVEDQAAEQERLRVELRGRLIIMAEAQSKKNFSYHGDPKTKRVGPQIKEYNHCTAEKFPLETEIETEGKKMAAEILRTQTDVSEERAAEIGREEAVREALPRIMKDSELRSCANFLWDYETKAYSDLFTASAKLTPDKQPILLPGDMLNYFGNTPANASAAIKNYVREKLPSWYKDIGKADLYKPLWDVHK